MKLGQVVRLVDGVETHSRFFPPGTLVTVASQPGRTGSGMDVVNVADLGGRPIISNLDVNRLELRPTERGTVKTPGRSKKTLKGLWR